MTRVWAAFGITIIIFTLAFTEFGLTKRNTNNLLEIIDKTEISARSSSNDTEELCGELKSLWNKKKRELEIFLSHSEIDQIDISVENLMRYCELNRFDNVYTECGVLRNRINALNDDEAINFNNLF